MKKIIDSIYENINPDLSWLKDNTIFLVKAGSHAYGTNIESSDNDYRGIAIPPKEYLFGFLKTFEQMIKKEPDVTIFNIQKIIKLCAECNPNAIEILFTDPSDYISINELGEELINNRELFISRLAKERFLGYAMSQWHRIQSHRDWILHPADTLPLRKDFGLQEHPVIPKEQLEAVQSSITKQLDRWNPDFEPFSEAQKIWLERNLGELLAELQITSDKQWECAARKFGCAENFIEILDQERRYTGAKKRYDQYQEWKLSRNKIRFDLEEKYHYDTKNALHMIRLSRMCIEILETGNVIVRRNDAKELLDIRNGKYSHDEISKIFNDLKIKMKLAYDSSILRKEPDRNKIDQLCIRLIEKSYR